MKKYITKYIFSFNGVSVLIGVLGLLSSFVTLFIDTKLLISIKYLLIILVIFLSLFIILLKLIFDLSKKQRPPAFENPINCNKISDDEIICLIRQNENFIYNIYVAGYLKRNQLDTLVCTGYVKNTQENFLQISLTNWIEKIELFDSNGNIKDEIIKSIEIRPVIPVGSIAHLND